MKILFLDIDGVVNCETTQQRHRGFIGIDPYMAFLVGKIVLDTDCKIVLSSSWRYSEEGVKEVEKQVYKIHDITGHVKSGHRGQEIKEWLMKNREVRRYAILDDSSDFYDYQPHFKTSWKEGITPEIAKEVTDFLNRKE